jgi:LysR family positive regulator for ilvC
MQQRELELFLDLCDTLRFAKTSERHHISPSALSRTIQRLEDEVGQPLFIRDNRSVVLTEAGGAFRTYARETIAHWRTLREELDRNRGTVRGELRLYASVTACYSILPDILGLFRRRYPEVGINLKTGDAALAIPNVVQDVVDVAVAALPEELPARLESQLVTTTPLICVGPTMDSTVTEQLARTTIPWSEVPFVLSQQGLARERIDDWFRRNHIQPRIYAQVSGNEAILAMVSLGCGAGIVPKLVVDKSPLKEQVRSVPGGPRIGSYHVGIVAQRKRLASPAVQAFWSII